jgi:transforming growth factor-beta-induced protein
LSNLGVTAEDLLAREDLGAILTYHVVPGTITAEALTELMNSAEGPLEVETVNGAVLTFAANDESGIDINEGAASIVQTDVMASNGVIHVIDNVLLPPADMDEAMATEEAMTMDTLVDVAMANEDFSTLVAAVTEAGLVETLSGGEFTVFAPTNGAFETLLSNLGVTAEDLLAREDLGAILTYHVVPGTITAESLTELMNEAEGPLEVETVNGALMTFAFNDEGGIDINGGAASIAQTDVMASNGVIHVIDNVLLPPTE